MRIQVFKNGKGLIHGSDAMRIGCDIEGVLKIGATEIKISPGEDSIMPLLFQMIKLVLIILNQYFYLLALVKRIFLLI